MIGTKKPPLFRLEFDAKRMRRMIRREPGSTVGRTFHPAKTGATCRQCSHSSASICTLTMNWQTPVRVSNYWTCDAFAERKGQTDG